MALRTTISDSDWKQPSEPTDTCVVGIQLIREVTEIDATQEASLMATLNASATVTNPVCDGVTYNGTYYVSDMDSIAQEGGDHPGSVTIRQKLTKIWTISSYTDLPTKIQMQGQDIIDAFYLNTVPSNPATGAQMKLTEDIIAYEWLYLNPANVAAIEALDTTNLKPTGYKEIRRRTDIEGKGDRTCSLRILYKKVTYPNSLQTVPLGSIYGVETSAAYVPVWSWQYREEGRNSVALAGNRLTRVAPGVDSTQLTNIIQTCNRASLSSTNAAADNSVVVVAVGARDGQDGSITVEQDLAKINTDVVATTRGLGGATAGAYLLGIGKDANGNYTALSRMWPQVSYANAIILCTPPSGYALQNVSDGTTTYKHKQATIRYDMQTGLCDVIQECDGATSGIFWWKKQGHTEVYAFHLETYNGLPWNVLTQQLLTTSEGLAIKFVNCTDNYEISSPWQVDCPEKGRTHKRGTIQFREDEVYDARRVIFNQSDTFQAPPTI